LTWQKVLLRYLNPPALSEKEKLDVGIERELGSHLHQAPHPREANHRCSTMTSTKYDPIFLEDKSAPKVLAYLNL
jgi:hypothetical protein